jgi:hypothetical protein
MYGAPFLTFFSDLFYFSNQITPAIFTTVRSVYASCLDDLYGTPAGTSNRCFADTDCLWGLDCNEVTQRCDIPWESPALPLAKCILDRKKQYVHQYFLWLLNLPQVITPEQLADELKAKFETEEADCVGPTAAKYSGQISCYDDVENRPDECRAVYNASGCLSEHQCNWHPCPTSNLEGKSCQELCEDTRIPGQSVCGWCSEGDFGQCYAASEAPGCVAPSALSRGECDIYAASNGVRTFWEPLDRVCYIISLTTRDQCIGGAISCTESNPPVVAKNNLWIGDDLQNTKLPAHEKIKLAQQQLVLEASITQRAPGSQFVTDLNWNRTVCPQVCFDRTRAAPECVDENCDHACCNREATCTDATVRACVCSIDAYCCDNWDEHCNRKAIDDGCVNCNCIRRSWDPLMNSGQGLCKVLMSTQEFCEDPWRGNGTWFSGRIWRHGRFSSKERCDEGSCDTDLTADTGKCRITQGCEGPLCKKCVTSKGPSSPDYESASQACSALSETQCYQCIYGLSSCAVNQTEALCIMNEEPCADRPSCERYGRCSDADYLASDSFFGRCVVDFIQTENSTATCPQAAVPLDLTPIGCVASTITDPILCTIDTVGADDPQWRYPSTDQQSCLLRYGSKCTHPTKDLGFGINSTIETWGQSCAECALCGGTCEPATVWLAGKWRIGQMLPMRWMPRDYAPINRGIATLNHTMVKEVLENAIQYRLRDSLASDVLCRYSGLGATMQKLSDICITKEVEQRFHSALRHPALVAQRTIFWNQAERIDLQPAYIEIGSDAVSQEDVRIDIRVTVYSMMDPYVNGTTPAKRDLAIDVVKLQPSGFLFGQLIGDGVRVDIYDAADDRRARKLKPLSAKLCIDVRNHPDLKWRQIFPVADLATVSSIVHPDTTDAKFQAFVPMMLESTKNITEFQGLWYEYNETTGEFQRMCISLNSSGLWYPSTRMAAVVTVTAWMPYVAIASFSVIFALAGRKFIWMLLYDRTKHRLMKPVTAFGSAVTAAMRIVLMIIVVRTRWQRAYPEDFILWNAFDWTSKLFMMLATEMFVVTNDVSARTGYCTNPVRLWWISLPAQLAIAAVFFVGFLRQFPLPDWSQEALEEFYRMEYVFNYVLSGTALIALFFLALYVIIKARTKRGRILTIAVSLITLGYYSRIIVWTYFDTFFGNLDKFWWHVGEMMLFEIVILFVIIFFHDATERLESKERDYTGATAVELDQALDDGSLPTRDELSAVDIEDITNQGDRVVAESERLIARMDGFIRKASGGLDDSGVRLGDESSSSTWGGERRSVVQLLDDQDYTIPEVFDQIDWNLRQIVSSGRSFETTAQSVLQKRGVLGQMSQDSQKRSDEQFGRNLADAVRELKSEKEFNRRPDRPTTMQIVERNLTDFPELLNDGLDDDDEAPPPRINFGSLPPPRASRVIARMQQDASDRTRLEQVREKLEEEQRRQVELDAEDEDDEDEQSSESDSSALLAPSAGDPAEASKKKKKNVFGRLKSALKKGGDKKQKQPVAIEEPSAFSSSYQSRQTVRFADRPISLPPPSGAPSARSSRLSFRNATQVPVLWRSLLQSSGVRKSEMYDPSTALFVANIVNDVLGGDLILDRFDGADLSQLPSLGPMDSGSLKSVSETLAMVMKTRREDSGLSFEGATDNDWTRD